MVLKTSSGPRTSNWESVRNRQICNLPIIWTASVVTECMVNKYLDTLLYKRFLGKIRILPCIGLVEEAIHDFMEFNCPYIFFQQANAFGFMDGSFCAYCTFNNSLTVIRNPSFVHTDYKIIPSALSLRLNADRRWKIRTSCSSRDWPKSNFSEIPRIFCIPSKNPWLGKKEDKVQWSSTESQLKK